MLPSISVSVDVAADADRSPAAMDLPSVGANSSNALVSLAVAVEPAPLLVVLVAFTVLVIDGVVMLDAKFTGTL